TQPDANVYVTGKEREYKGHVAGIIVDDLGKQLAGKKIGDELALTLVGPASHENEKIKDQPITIKIKINKVQRVEPAAIDTLVAQFGQESIETFRTQVRESLEERAEREGQA